MELRGKTVKFIGKHRYGGQHAILDPTYVTLNPLFGKMNTQRGMRCISKGATKLSQTGNIGLPRADRNSGEWF